MSASLNKVQLIGNLGRDPEVRYTGDNKAIANVTLATTKKWKDQAGAQQERTEWHRVVFFNKVAEIVEKYLKKGSKIYVEGELQTRKWEDKDGNERYTTEVVVNGIGTSMQMLGGKGDREETSDEPRKEAKPAASNDAFDEDIPF